MDKRVGELQKAEPEKYWKVAETHEGAQSFKLSNPDGSTAGHYAMYDRPDHVEFGTLVAEPGQRGIAKSALDDLDSRVPDKVQRLDAFDGELTSIYSKYGFKETDRVTWDDKYAPSSWKPEYGRPDVVFMERPSAVDRQSSERSIRLRDARGRFVSKRAARLSTLERRIIKDSDQCPQCVANNDPRNVPVHPNCHCNVITDSIEAGVADSEHRLFQPIDTDEIEIVGAELAEGESLKLDPATAALLDAEDVRFSDIARWLEQMQPYLEQGSQYVSIVIDDDSDEALAEAQELVEAAAEGSEEFAEAIRNKKLWFALAKVVTL